MRQKKSRRVDARNASSAGCHKLKRFSFLLCIEKKRRGNEMTKKKQRETSTDNVVDLGVTKM